MIERLKQWLAPPIFEDEEKTRVARLVNIILLAILAIMVLTVFLVAGLASSEFGITLAAAAVVAFIITGLRFLARRGNVQIVSTILTTTFLILVTLSIFGYRGVRDLTITGYFIVIALAALLLGGRAVIVFGFLCVTATVGAYLAEIGHLIPVPMEAITPPFQLIALLVVMGLMSLLLRFVVRSIAQGNEYIRRNARALAEANRELETSRNALQARTKDLETRNRQARASAEIGHAATSILESAKLIRQVVNLICERFDLYYVGLFMADDAGEWAVLQAGTGEAGQKMLARGHKIKIGSGMIGWSIANAQARIALEAGEDTIRLATAELPETRSEAALPLRSRGKVIGALSVQSAQPSAFDPDTIAMLQTMADQVAVALDNARLFAQSQQALEAARRAYGELSQKAWTELLQARPDMGYRSDESSVTGAGGIWRPEMEQAVQEKRAVQSDHASDQHSLAVPIRLGDNVIGVLDTCKPSQAGMWTPEEIAILEELAGQLGLALESARLYQDTQRRAAREKLTSQATARMRETLDIDLVLQTAARQVGQALGAHEVNIRLTTAEKEEQP